MKVRHLGLALVVLLLTSGIAWAGKEAYGAVQEEISKILGQLNLELAHQTKFCKQLLNDFQAQAGIQYVKPIVETNDFNDPALKAYTKKCPNLELRKRVLLNPRWADDLKEESPEEREKYGDVYMGTANFKLYKVDINNKAADGKEFVFYHEKFLHVSHLGETLDLDVGKEYDNRGEYLVVNFEDCQVQAGVPVDDWRQKATVKSYSDVISYKNAQYIFDLFPSQGPETYSLALWGYSNKRERLTPMCLIQPILPGSKSN